MLKLMRTRYISSNRSRRGGGGGGGGEDEEITEYECPVRKTENGRADYCGH